MKIVLLLIAALPFAILVSLNNTLTNFQTNQDQHPPTPVLIAIPGATLVPQPNTTPIATLVPSSGREAAIEQVIQTAMTWLGTPYLWSGCTRRGVDCSCFVLNDYASIGIKLPRTTVPQMAAYPRVNRDQVEAGDLVFFNNTCTDCGLNPTHVGLALDNSRMIQAGDPVQISSFSSGFYAAHYAGAVRPLQ